MTNDESGSGLFCDGCGTPQVLAPGIGYYCPNKVCDYEQQQAKAFARQWRDEQERAEYERLKAKFGTTNP